MNNEVPVYVQGLLSLFIHLSPNLNKSLALQLALKALEIAWILR